jgi:hypothetical protein
MMITKMIRITRISRERRRRLTTAGGVVPLGWAQGGDRSFSGACREPVSEANQNRDRQPQRPPRRVLRGDGLDCHSVPVRKGVRNDLKILAIHVDVARGRVPEFFDPGTIVRGLSPARKLHQVARFCPGTEG